jgi:hypothetical protein
MEKKDLKEFESEMNVNSEFFGLFRNELLNMGTNKKRSKNRITNKSRIETTTLIQTNLSSSESEKSEKSDKREKLEILDKSNKSNKSNILNKLNKVVEPVNQVNPVSKLNSVTKTKTEITNNEIGLTEYEKEKLIQIINYFANINQ